MEKEEEEEKEEKAEEVADEEDGGRSLRRTGWDTRPDGQLASLFRL